MDGWALSQVYKNLDAEDFLLGNVFSVRAQPCLCRIVCPLLFHHTALHAITRQSRTLRLRPRNDLASGRRRDRRRLVPAQDSHGRAPGHA